MKLRPYPGLPTAMTLALSLCLLAAARATAAESPIEHPWQLGFHLGQVGYEGDEEVQDSMAVAFHLGYDYSERWTFEGILLMAPSLDGNTRNSYGQKINRLKETAGVSDTSAWGLGVEAMYHLTRWERLDPYFGVGGSLMFYADDLGSGTTDPALRAGAGVMYHFNDEWAVRADWRGYIAGGDTEANMLTTVGVVWTIGAGVPPAYEVGGGARDNDADGLTDTQETDVYRTDPNDPDTDDDGLTDYQEVKQYKTNPLNPDTDFDLLGDGEEVFTHKTNPRDADTDNGGVIDGHEVREDGTDPLNGADDLILYTLYIHFDTDKAVIKPEYFGDIDKIGKVLTREPNATAVIEGHADRRKTSTEEHNQKLSEARAKAVLDYLATKWHIDRARLKSVGYGFARPVEDNHPVHGSARNRRVEVYIRGASRETVRAHERARLAPPGADTVTITAEDAGMETGK